MIKQFKFTTWVFSFFLLATSAFLLLFFPGCKGILHKEDEGSIEYDIAYADSMKNDFMISMFPTKMTLKFKPGLTLNELKMGMGIITASFIADAESKTLTALFKVVDKHFALKHDSLQTIEELNQLPKFSIEYLSETKEIAGYKCNKVMATQIGNASNTFTIFYTTEIHINNPNWSLPYPEITGVLMEYQLEHKGIAMQLKAKKVNLEDLDDEIFTATPEYKVVTKNELPDIIKGFL